MIKNTKTINNYPIDNDDINIILYAIRRLVKKWQQTIEEKSFEVKHFITSNDWDNANQEISTIKDIQHKINRVEELIDKLSDNILEDSTPTANKEIDIPESPYRSLIAIGYICKWNWNKISEWIQSDNKVSNIDLANALNSIHTYWVTIAEDGYPEQYKSVYKPPFVIFWVGSIQITQNHNLIAMVGNNTKNLKPDQTYVWSISDRKDIDKILLKHSINNIFVVKTIKPYEKYQIKEGNLILAESYDNVLINRQLTIWLGLTKKYMLNGRKLTLQEQKFIKAEQLEQIKN